MRFTPQFLDELKARLPVSEVVGKRVKLIRSGREFKGLSPFGKEKTPSFFVNDQKEAWFDFSSGKNGSIFDFIMLTEGVGFPEAVERLAQMAGVALPKVSPEEQQRSARAKSLHDVMDLAAKFFEATLASRLGARARGYLADRALTAATQVQFRIGYAPSERFALKEHLGSHGIPVGDMIEAGLLVAGDDIPVPFDRFRDRVMFPITDSRGRVIAFGGRAMDKEVAAKYLNSPETPLFHKGHTLYNIAMARQAMHDGAKTNAQLIAVEGYVDVIAMVTAGFPASVAPLGTALTEEQLGLLWKMADEPVLCFDGDGAGVRAAYRAMDLALPRLKPGKSLKFALLPTGQDPDDLLRSSGRDAVVEVIAAARPMGQMLWSRETEGHAFDTPERRAALEARVNEVTALIADESVRKYYRQDFNDRLRQFLNPGFAGRGQFPPRGGQGAPQSNWRDRQGVTGTGPANRFGAKRPEVGSRNTPYVVVSQQMAASPVHRGYRTSVPTREALILQAALNYPWLLHDHLEELASLEFRHLGAQQLKAALIDIAAHSSDHAAGLEPETLRAELKNRQLGEVLERIEASITSHSVWGSRPDASPQDVLITWQQLVALQHQHYSLTKELEAVTQALGEDASETNYLRLRDVKDRLSQMDGTEALIEGFGASSGRGARSL